MAAVVVVVLYFSTLTDSNSGRECTVIDLLMAAVVVVGWVVVTGVVVVVSIPFIWSPVQITINVLQNTRDIVTGVRCTTCLRQLTFWITLAVSRHLAEPTFCMQSKANHYVILGTCLNKDNNVCKGFSRQQHAGSQELFQLIAFNQFSGFKNCVVLYNEMHSQKSLWQMESLVSHVVQK